MVLLGGVGESEAEEERRGKGMEKTPFYSVCPILECMHSLFQHTHDCCPWRTDFPGQEDTVTYPYVIPLSSAFLEHFKICEFGDETSSSLHEVPASCLRHDGKGQNEQVQLYCTPGYQGFL